MVDHKRTPNNVKVGGPLFERLAFEYLEKKYNISKEDILDILHKRQDIDSSIPVSILAVPKLSSLEAIVKFLRENRKLSYNVIGNYLKRKPKTLAVTYAVAHKKMPERFSEEFDKDNKRIPFTAFSENLSILECICNYLKSSNRSYAEISRMLEKDQRTIWTVCNRAERKLRNKDVNNTYD